jgi:uncharacterized membrane protein
VKPIDLLQGKWLGHPLHPAIVHIPVGTWIVAAVLDIISRQASPGSARVYVSLYCVIVGLIGALFAVPTGIAEWSAIKKEKPAWKLGLYHMAVNLLASIIWAANLGLRWQAFDQPAPISVAVMATSIAGALVVLGGGYLGSLMTFDHGISVARQSKKKWRAIAARGGARLPEPK